MRQPVYDALAYMRVRRTRGPGIQHDKDDPTHEAAREEQCIHMEHMYAEGHLQARGRSVPEVANWFWGQVSVVCRQGCSHPQTAYGNRRSLEHAANKEGSGSYTQFRTSIIYTKDKAMPLQTRTVQRHVSRYPAKEKARRAADAVHHMSCLEKVE